MRRGEEKGEEEWLGAKEEEKRELTVFLGAEIVDVRGPDGLIIFIMVGELLCDELDGVADELAPEKKYFQNRIKYC